jgi:hypothetical protein
MDDIADRRPPGLPNAAAIRPSDQSAYDFMLTRVRGSEDAQIGTIAGEPYGAAYFRALANAPVIGEALGRLGAVAMEVPGGEGTLSAADHEFADAVIAFDSGYTWLLAGHGPLAIKAGVRLEALEALRGDQEQELTDDERQQVEFTRAVRDGRVTAEIWEAMVRRLGSERGAIEYAFFVLLVLLNHQLASAMGVPGMTQDELDAMFAGFREQDPGVSYHDYSRLYGDAAFQVKGDD